MFPMQHFKALISLANEYFESSLCTWFFIFALHVSAVQYSSMATSQVFDRAVVSPALLQAIDVNKPKPFNPTFGALIPPEWLLPSECKNVADEDKENDSFQPPSNKKPQPSLSLKKKSSSERFSEPVTSPQH